MAVLALDELRARDHPLHRRVHLGTDAGQLGLQVHHGHGSRLAQWDMGSSNATETILARGALESQTPCQPRSPWGAESRLRARRPVAEPARARRVGKPP